MKTARQVAGFLRASFDRSLDSTGRADLVVGAALGVIGWAMNVDLGQLALAIIVGVFLVRWLILSPAAMWAGRDEADESGGVVVQPGGTYIENYFAAGSNSESAGTALATGAEPATGIGSAYDATVRVEPTPPARRSRHRSRRDPTDPPPSLGL